MKGNTTSVRLEIKNPRVREELQKIIFSMVGFNIQKMDYPGPCDLLIMEIGEDLKREFQTIHALQASGRVRGIFLTCSRMEPDLLIQAMRAGAKEFFSQPIKTEEVSLALLKFRERKEERHEGREPKRRGKIIYTIGSKGGVGTTTTAVNLATSLAELQSSLSVVLIDMNFLFGEIPIFLDIKSTFNWGELARNISRVDATYLMSILSKHPSGVFVLPSPTGLDGASMATPEIMEKLLTLMRDVFDFIIVDGGASFSDLSLRALGMSDVILLLAQLNLPCITKVKRILSSFQGLGYPHPEAVRVVINRYQKNSLISLKKAEESINRKIFWTIPNDFATTMSAINQGKSISMAGGGTKVHKNLQELAASFIERGPEKEKERGGFWSRIIA